MLPPARATRGGAIPLKSRKPAPGPCDPACAAGRWPSPCLTPQHFLLLRLACIRLCLLGLSFLSHDDDGPPGPAPRAGRRPSPSLPPQRFLLLRLACIRLCLLGLSFLSHDDERPAGPTPSAPAAAGAGSPPCPGCRRH